MALAMVLPKSTEIGEINMKVKWFRHMAGEGPDSKCGRFHINALYMGTTRPQGYQLHDEKTGKYISGDTISEMKFEAERLVES